MLRQVVKAEELRLRSHSSATQEDREAHFEAQEKLKPRKLGLTRAEQVLEQLEARGGTTLTIHVVSASGDTVDVGVVEDTTVEELNALVQLHCDVDPEDQKLVVGEKFLAPRTASMKELNIEAGCELLLIVLDHQDAQEALQGAIEGIKGLVVADIQRLDATTWDMNVLLTVLVIRPRGDEPPIAQGVAGCRKMIEDAESFLQGLQAYDARQLGFRGAHYADVFLRRISVRDEEIMKDILPPSYAIMKWARAVLLVFHAHNGTMGLMSHHLHRTTESQS
eukprot:TRINITY_DN90185_c0_g1_i1.p1 TRINITY_DN90185_c0_g1~~TRINITY_DN90185_c0_g1_i1.p1  ORF type:complete len:279 (+),score=29.88 TRINITY_DN90185_c0_g1_i1:327-1163(+)